ncbi:HigA family addiction module antidote protein [Rosenbergiella epipactidis]|uniref:HigA family addiction module antitoxin n=1 Tax=Rosenbergiella epipactidis TaxID=1544694 RepID=UPI001BDA8A5F|nr:HigA family addiction module antitoxin [Rosenbergiella epipactidis]MBT0717872.1 HigA family addiction module antidote protein [Rosenbergiella epipactidis]
MSEMFNPPHVGEVVAEIIEGINIGTREFSRAMNISPSSAHRLLNGQTVVTPDMAVKLSAVLGNTPKFWLNLQANYSLYHAESSVDTSHLRRLVADAPPAAMAQSKP